MKIETYNIKGEKTGTAELPEGIFGAAWKPALVKQVYDGEMANKRRPWAHTKTRGEVSGGGRKPWRQKGIKKCVRPGCSKTQTVWREIRGVPAFDDFSCHTAYPWRVYSTRMEQMKKTEQAIDLLPNAFCKPTPFD